MDNEIGDLEAIAVGKTYVEGGREHVVLDALTQVLCRGIRGITRAKRVGKINLLNLLSPGSIRRPEARC